MQDALDRLMAGRTTVVVAHRLSTIRNADVIGVLQKGVIVERGGYDELLEQGGAFAALVHLQGGPTPAAEAGKKGASEVHKVDGDITPSTKLPIQVADIPMRPGAPAKNAIAAVAREPKAEDEASAKAAPRAPLARLARLNFPELHYIFVGLVSAAGNGAIFPAFAIIFGSLLEVFFLPAADKLRSEAKFWALVRPGDPRGPCTT